MLLRSQREPLLVRVSALLRSALPIELLLNALPFQWLSWAPHRYMPGQGLGGGEFPGEGWEWVEAQL